MITAASTAELAIILIDARKGMLTQTHRHSYLCHLIGINNFMIAINKMDLVDYSEDIFKKISYDYSEFAKKIGIKIFQPSPFQVYGATILLIRQITHHGTVVPH